MGPFVPTSVGMEYYANMNTNTNKLTVTNTNTDTGMQILRSNLQIGPLVHHPVGK